MQSWKLQTEIAVLHEKLATLQTNFDQLKNTTTNFVGHLNVIRTSFKPIELRKSLFSLSLSLHLSVW